jgi:hypothetical protein
MLTKYYVRFTEKAQNGDTITPFSVKNGQELSAVILESSVRLNGIESMIKQDFVKKFADDLRQTLMFSGVVTEPPLQRPPKVIEMSLSVSEATDNHTELWLINLILAVITYGILLLFLQWKTDFKSEMMLTVKRLDGNTKQYAVKSSGSVNREAFTDHSRAITDMISQVTNNNVHALMNQLIADSVFYLEN